jgi:hypothetical protein
LGALLFKIACGYAHNKGIKDIFALVPSFAGGKLFAALGLNQSIKASPYPEYIGPPFGRKGEIENVRESAASLLKGKISILWESSEVNKANKKEDHFSKGWVSCMLLPILAGLAVGGVVGAPVFAAS